MLENYRTSSLSDSEKALFAFVEKLNRHPDELKRQDVEDLKAAGWSDEAVFDLITVCSLFNFYNCWVAGSGVKELPPEACEASARHLAKRGYTTHSV